MRQLLTALSLVLALAAPAAAQYSAYDNLVISTTTGRARRNLSGFFVVAKSSTSPTTYTIVLDGVSGSIQASSGTFVYGVKATTGVFSGNVTAGSFTGAVTAGSVDFSTITTALAGKLSTTGTAAAVASGGVDFSTITTALAGKLNLTGGNVTGQLELGSGTVRSTFTTTGQLKIPSQASAVVIGTNTMTTPMVSIRGAGTANNLIEFWKHNNSGASPNSWIDGFGDAHFSVYTAEYDADVSNPPFQGSGGGTDTGVYFPSAGIIGITSGGTEVARFTTQGLSTSSGTFSEVVTASSGTFSAQMSAAAGLAGALKSNSTGVSVGRNNSPSATALLNINDFSDHTYAARYGNTFFNNQGSIHSSGGEFRFGNAAGDEARFKANSSKTYANGMGFYSENTSAANNAFSFYAGASETQVVTISTFGAITSRVGQSTATVTPGYCVTIATTGTSSALGVLISTYNTTNAADELVHYFSVSSGALSQNGMGIELLTSSNNQTADTYKIRVSFCGTLFSIINRVTTAASAYSATIRLRRISSTLVAYDSVGFDSTDDTAFVTNSAKSGTMTCDFNATNNLLVYYNAPAGQQGLAYSSMCYR